MSLSGSTSLLVISFLFGLIFGSFYNVCIYRLPLGKSIVKPRSFCPKCERAIPWYENIPVLSWIFLRGKCAGCGTGISFRYTFVELTSGVIFAYGVHAFGLSLKTAEFVLLGSLMLILFFTDLHERILPDKITLWFIPVGLAFAYFATDRTLLESVLVGVAGAGGLYLLAWGYLKLKGVEGMGMGDVKMLALMGAFLGIKAFLALMIAAVIGTFVGLFLIYGMKKGREYEIPFGCFLSLGTMIAYLYGAQLIAWYVGKFIVI